jgi:uncharacterized FAD-dependent dehydrogenase
MLRLNNIELSLDHVDSDLAHSIASALEIDVSEVVRHHVFKRSFDARKKTNIKLIYQVDVELAATLEASLLNKYSDQNVCRTSPDTSYHFVAHADEAFPSAYQQRPIVIGFGPCGILAALLLAQMGLRPIVLERGKEVRERTVDTWAFWRKGKLNTESNVQFGEGGAGTFSDGKLYSQVKDKRFLGRKVQMEFVKAGAPEEILYVSKPHIGTFKLVKMVENIRAEIIRLGGEIRFGAKVEQLQFEVAKYGTSGTKSDTTGRSPTNQVAGVILADGEALRSRHVVLGVGHSARDTFQMLLDEGVYVEPKPFSIGFRIEHPQSVIDRARFGKQAGHPILGAADYKLVHHCDNGRSVYSFCMCPGGTVVAAASEPGGVVTNGMSQYSRNERNANSAIVVGINPEQDYPGDPLAGIRLQRTLEQQAFALGGANYDAPAQLVGDFLDNQPSVELASTVPSYQPGIKLTDLSGVLPAYAIEAIREAIPAFDKQIKGFAMREALLTAVETRTSSPICIKRDKNFESINTRGLYPAGEGAGYAGGILSAGIDGIKVAEAIALSMLVQPQYSN